MSETPGDLRASANCTRYRPGQTAGHYESFFLRANHPARPLAFWIRYTIFHPAGRPADAIGELWSVFFDGESGEHVAAKTEMPITQCRFSPDRLDVVAGAARLDATSLAGEATSSGHRIAWDLSYGGDAPPLFLLPPRLYSASLPKAKSLVPLPMAAFRGTLQVDDRRVDVEEWIGSQNHNWGERHTDQYAWGQVAGFDTHPDSFLELGTARLRIGPLWTPFLTPLVLRHEGREHVLNTPSHLLKARASFRYFDWQFRTGDAGVRIEGSIRAPRESFVGLAYYNPPGGTKHCLNSKLATCTLLVSTNENGRWSAPQTLATQHRAAFEILTDARDHGVAIRA